MAYPPAQESPEANWSKISKVREAIPAEGAKRRAERRDFPQNAKPGPVSARIVHLQLWPMLLKREPNEIKSGKGGPSMDLAVVPHTAIYSFSEDRSRPTATARFCCRTDRRGHRRADPNHPSLARGPICAQLRDQSKSSRRRSMGAG